MAAQGATLPSIYYPAARTPTWPALQTRGSGSAEVVLLATNAKLTGLAAAGRVRRFGLTATTVNAHLRRLVAVVGARHLLVDVVHHLLEPTNTSVL